MRRTAWRGRAGCGRRAGQGHVTLDWDPVPGAAGYLVYRAAGEPYEPLDHGGGDVLAVPAGPYADTSGEPGRVRHYAVAAVADGASAGPLSDAVAAAPAAARGRAAVTIEVGAEPAAGRSAGELARPWQPMIGSEHLSCLLRRDRTGGRAIGTELREALRIAHDELGVRAVRAHGILDDDLGVYTESGGRAVHDFSGIDRVYDQLMEIGLRPVVELSFMPAALARDPARTVFTYGAIISPPRDWDRWAALTGDLAAHLIQRYGRDEVTSRWAFEVWNEPNLEVFWSGTPEEYFRLYDVSARAVTAGRSGAAGGRAVLGGGGLDLGAAGPPGVTRERRLTSCPPTSTGTCRWTCGRCSGRSGGPGRRSGGPSGAPPRPTSTTSATRCSRRRSCSAAWPRRWAGSRRCRTGWPPTISRNSARLLSCSTAGSGCCRWGTCASPGTGRWRCWPGSAGPGCRSPVSGDGAGGLVEALAARHEDGRTGILVWNVTLDQGKIGGDPLLARRIRLRVSVPPGTAYTVRHYRIDEGHSNVVTAWERMRAGAAWPSREQWAELAEVNTLDELSPPGPAAAGGGDGHAGVLLRPADAGRLLPGADPVEPRRPPG